MAKIGGCAPEAVIAPGGIFTGHAQKEFDGLFGNRWAPEFLAAVAVVPFPGHEFTMPTKEGVRGDDGSDFLQRVATQYFSFDGKAAALVIVEQDAFIAKLHSEHLILGFQIFDYILLVAIEPTGEDEKEQLPGF